MTSSGYPRIVKQWKRGTPLRAGDAWCTKASPTTCTSPRTHDHTPGFERDFVSRTLAFYNDELYLRGTDGKLAKIDAPNSANKSVHKRLAAARTARALRQPAATTYPAGA